jgi:hypothetical protein
MKKKGECLLTLLFTVLIFLSISCEKTETEFNSKQLILKSQDVDAYVYQEYEGIHNYTVVIPLKIYVRGGTPDHETGDYHFKLAEGTKLPHGLMLDTICGVISGNNEPIEPVDKIESFEIVVNDGRKTVVKEYKLVTRYITSGLKMPIPIMQFCSPETSLQCDINTSSYGVSFSMMGGKPPYTFSLATDETLPGGLSLNARKGVISGNLKDITKGLYNFKIQCTDTDGNQAISMCTSQKYEKYTLIVK